jgi:uncharacterized protein YkwD
VADLAGAVHARPATFTDILLPRGSGRGDAIDADAGALKVKTGRGEASFPWEAVPPKSFVKLFRQAGFDDPPRLAVALFFDEEALPEEARGAYVAYFRSGQDPALLTRLLARRRGVEPPPQGFELFRGDLVTAAERERVVLEERVEALGKQARSTLEKRRREAWAELEAIGAPAAETLAAVLQERREQVAAALEGSNAFSQGRFVSLLGRQLTAAREAARAFIGDPNRYPYPNKSEDAQVEAERLVEAVREIYERPYAALLAASDEAKALDAELSELDGRLARTDPLSEPLRDAAVEKVLRRLDVPNLALGSEDRERVDYNRAVEAYNRNVTTTADEEERANVAAVNEYRHMMGLHAVKIDERLVRAARKHSIEMQQLDYFDHDSPTPSLRTPAQRAAREGYGGGVAENIARGAGTGTEAFWQWFKSSGHHRNMLIPGHTEMGCGAAVRHWWTQKFGRMTGRNLEPPKVPPDPDPPGTSGNGRPPPGQ